MQDALVLLAKGNAVDDVARRLTPMSKSASSKLATAFFKDAVTAATSLQVDVWCSTEGDDKQVRSMLPSSIRVFKRNDGDYAMRLVTVADTLFSSGYRRVVIVPTDCPTVDPHYIRLAFDALVDNDAVLGPADDGGYVLVGLTKPIPRLFLDVDMGTPKVLRQTLLKARELDLRMNIIPARGGLNSLNELHAAIERGELSHAANTLSTLTVVSV